MNRPLTLWVHEVDTTANRETRWKWRADELFSALDEFSEASLERVHAENDAQFIVELVVTPDPNVKTLLLRESIVVMTSAHIAATANLDQWEAIATRFASMIDAAAVCYATPLATA